ncbi:helix-turn-helix domain-containing protein [Streptomyces sp. YIM S03343]
MIGSFGGKGASAMDMGMDSGAGSTESDSNVAFLRCFGRQMKLLREAAGLTQVQVATMSGTARQ